MAKYIGFCPVCGMVNFDDKPKCLRCGRTLEPAKGSGERRDRPDRRHAADPPGRKPRG